MFAKQNKSGTVEIVKVKKNASEIGPDNTTSLLGQHKAKAPESVEGF